MTALQPQRHGGDGQTAIIRTAVQFLMVGGFAGTSIDAEARRLGSTKGRIYDFLALKVNLLFAVAQRGMKFTIAAIRRFIPVQASPTARLKAMAVAHPFSMIEIRADQRCVWDGVEIHPRSATTPEQRDRLTVLPEGRDSQTEATVARQQMFPSLNSLILWCASRKSETKAELERLAEQCEDYALRGLGAARRMQVGSGGT